MGIEDEKKSSDADNQQKPKKVTNVPTDVLKHTVGSFLTPEEAAAFEKATKFFKQPQERKADYFVVTARPEELLKLMVKDPMLYFKTYPEITDPDGQTFYNISPADLVHFLSDDDMLWRVDEFAQNIKDEKQRAEFFAKWEAHQASRGRGGADMVKVTGTNSPTYESVIKSSTSYTLDDYLDDDLDDDLDDSLDDGTTVTIERSLLKNPNGIICWIDDNQKEHWYYVNRETKSLEPVFISKEAKEQSAYQDLLASMQKMEPFTARRSSNKEHALISAIMLRSTAEKKEEPINIVREGIKYKDKNGIEYIDNHFDFNLYDNAYVKCMRLVAEAKSLYDAGKPDEGKQKYDEADIAWRAELGDVQRQVMWILRHYCKSDRQFYFIPNFILKQSPFIGSYEIYNFLTSFALSDLTPEEFRRLSDDDNIKEYLKHATDNNYKLVPFSKAEFDKLSHTIDDSRHTKIKDLRTKLVGVGAKLEQLFDVHSGRLHPGLGVNSDSGFAIHKGVTVWQARWNGIAIHGVMRGGDWNDFAMISRIIKDANIFVDGFKPAVRPIPGAAPRSP